MSKFLDEYGLARVWKNTKDYVDGKFFSGGGGEVYSTEETRIGTWIDGKPLYRRVYQVDVESKAGEQEILALDMILDTVISFSAVVREFGKGVYRSIPMTTTGGSSGYDTVTGNGYIIIVGPGHATVPNTVRLKLPVASWAGTLTLVLEYTKTTD